jgi:hypothetical protein
MWSGSLGVRYRVIGKLGLLLFIQTTFAFYECPLGGSPTYFSTTVRFTKD